MTVALPSLSIEVTPAAIEAAPCSMIDKLGVDICAMIEPEQKAA
jgi:hypothetical protein